MIPCRKQQRKNVGISLILLKMCADLKTIFILPENVLLICGAFFGTKRPPKMMPQKISSGGGHVWIVSSAG